MIAKIMTTEIGRVAGLLKFLSDDIRFELVQPWGIEQAMQDGSASVLLFKILLIGGGENNACVRVSHEDATHVIQAFEDIGAQVQIISGEVSHE